jgi:hypothetical protein
MQTQLITLTVLANKFCFLNFFSMLNSFTPYRCWLWDNRPIFFFSGVADEGTSGVNAPPVHGIKKGLDHSCFYLGHDNHELKYQMKGSVIVLGNTLEMTEICNDVICLFRFSAVALHLGNHKNIIWYDYIYVSLLVSFSTLSARKSIISLGCHLFCHLRTRAISKVFQKFTRTCFFHTIT